MTKQMRVMKLSLLTFIISAGFNLQGCQTSLGEFPRLPSNPPVITQTSGERAPSTLSDDVTGTELAQLADESNAMQAQNNLRTGNFPPVKIGLLLPLSGQNAALGQAMMNAAQMAAFELGHQNFELLPRDTKGTAQGGADAAQSALSDGAQLLLGPVFAEAVNGAKNVAAARGVKIIAYTTNWALADQNTYIMGFLPFDQIDRLLSYSASQSLYNIGVLAPRNDYGNIATGAYRQSAQKYGIQSTKITRYTGTSGLPRALSQFSQGGSPEAIFPHNAVFLPTNAAEITDIAEAGKAYGLTKENTDFLGTGLWDDARLARNPALDGAIFAAPDPGLRRDFEGRYQSLYTLAPPRIATLAYDSVALAAILAQAGLRHNGAPAFDTASFQNPNGFAGVDGIFRFRPDGIAERGLAILEYTNGTIQVREPAPKTFQ